MSNRTGKSQAKKADETPTENLPSKEEVVGRSNVVERLRSQNKNAFRSLDLSGFTLDELKDLRNKGLELKEQLAQQKAELLRGTGSKSKK